LSSRHHDPWVWEFPPPASEASEPPSQETLSAFNLAFHQYITHPRDPTDALFITRTKPNGDVRLRMAIGAERTTDTDVRRAVDILERVRKNILKEAGYTIEGEVEMEVDENA